MSAHQANISNLDKVSLFHGSPFRFDTFKPSKAGIHFGTYEQAAHAATMKLARIPVDVFASLDEVNGWRGKIYQCELQLGKTKRIADPRTPQAWSRQIKKAINEGYDSIVYANDYEGSAAADSYCIFSSSQVIGMRVCN